MFSRSSGEEMLELQFILASRSGAPLAVAFVDLDHFKSINDHYGHEAGDKVLIAMTRNIQACLRRGDILPVGGEEFLPIMPNTDLEQAIGDRRGCANMGWVRGRKALSGDCQHWCC